MSLVKAKQNSKHSDSTTTNNGGIILYSPRGNTPENMVGNKYTENPVINTVIKHSNI
jgi:hypothetical protein